MSGYFYLGTALLSVANGTVMFVVNPERSINRMFFFASLWIAVWSFCVFMVIQVGDQYTGGPAHILLFWLRLSSVVAAFTGWFVCLMRAALLTPHHSTTRLIVDSIPWFLISSSIAVLALTESFVPSDSTPINSKRGAGYYVYSAVILVSCIYFLCDTIKQIRFLPGARRIEMQFFVFNSICACVAIVVLHLVGGMLGIPWLRRLGPLGFIVIHALTVWAVCSHKVFDARQVISSIAQRVVFLCILGCAAVAAVLGLNGLVDSPFDVLLGALLTGVFAIVFERPTRKWFGLDPDSLLAAPRRSIIDCARQEPDAEKLKTRFEKIIREWCQADRIELLSRKEGGFNGTQTALSNEWPVLPTLVGNSWLTPEFLQRKRSDLATADCVRWMAENQCGALLAVPRGSDRPSLLVVLGQRESLRPYTYPDIQLLLPLAELMDNILAHATLAQQAAKLAALESAMMVSRSLAHDLSSLTTPIAAYLVCAEDRTKRGTPEASVLGAAKHSVTVMGRYIRESLLFSRRLMPAFRAMNPRAAVASAVQVAQGRAAKRDVTLVSECAAGASLVADPALFERLVLNLVNNAIDASPRRGMVRISVGLDQDKVRLRVEDQGGGIPAENAKRIFDPYFTTKNTGDTDRGLGLGLAICRKITDLHQGDITVGNLPGQGAIFTATFPRRPKAAREVPLRTELEDPTVRDSSGSTLAPVSTDAAGPKP